MQDKQYAAQAYGDALDKLLEGVVSNAQHYHIRTTSGTTSDPVIAVQRYAPFWNTRYGDSVAVVACYGQRSLRLFQALTASMQYGTHTVRVLCLDADDIHSELSGLVATFAPDRVQGHVSFIGRVSVDFSSSLESVQRIHAVGERLSEVTADLFRARFPNARIILDYLSVELGAIGRGCEHQPPNYYHPETGVHIDLHEPDPEGRGTILVTKTYNTVSFRQFNTGDSGRLVLEPCACGAVNTFEHLGRTGLDHIKLCGTLIRQDQFERALAPYAHTFDDFRIAVREATENGMIKGALALILYRTGSEASPSLIAEMSETVMRDVFLTPSQTFADLVAQKLFLPLSITYSDTPFKTTTKNLRFL